MKRLTAEEAAAFPTLLRTVSGSEVHGTGLPGGDIDHMGVAAEAKRDVVGTGNSPEAWGYRTAWERPHADGEEGRSVEGDLDLTIYPARKWARLALNGNPSVLVPLFAGEEFVIEMNEAGAELRENRDRLMSQVLVRRHLNYATSQKERMLGLRSQRTNRPELVETHGFDTKFASHVLRLSHQGLGVLRERTLLVPLPEDVAGSILAVRRGERELADVLEEANRLERAIADELERSTLPERADTEWVDGWLDRAHHAAWWWESLVSGQQGRVPAGSRHGGEFTAKGQSAPDVRLRR